MERRIKERRVQKRSVRGRRIKEGEYRIEGYEGKG